jgi:hypothetical protein
MNQGRPDEVSFMFRNELALARKLGCSQSERKLRSVSLLTEPLQSRGRGSYFPRYRAEMTDSEHEDDTLFMLIQLTLPNPANR